jgi:hypothetical protein
VSVEKLSSYWLAAGRLIGFRVEAPYSLTLANGHTIRVAACLPDMGGRRGMLVVYSFDEIEHHMDELLQAGYGFSVLGQHIDNAIERESVVQLIKDWGWTGVAVNAELK